MPTFVNTGVYDCPALGYAQITGVIAPANIPPDTGNVSIVIPLTITAYTPATRKPSVNVVATLPLVESISNTVWGGNSVGVGPTGLAKVSLEGFIQTPVNSSTHLPTGQVISTGQWLHYTEIISAAMEGRTTNVGAIWVRQEPLWFRDPYGRRYDNPRVLDFTATFVEGAPGRHNFTMTLVV